MNEDTENEKAGGDKRPRVGSLFAGVGGFDLGFERAGMRTVWAVEWDGTNRAVLADRFPAAALHGDVCEVRPEQLEKVEVICGGFPCQDISTMGNGAGLSGARSGLVGEVFRLLSALQSEWVVLENVPQLLYINEGRDFARVLQGLGNCGYHVAWRVLDSAGFGVPQGRRRLFMVGRAGADPPGEFIFDAAPVERLPRASDKENEPYSAGGYTAGTLLRASSATQVGLTENFVVHEDGWGAMVERERVSEATGIPWGMGKWDFRQRQMAGNAVTVTVAEWIGRILVRAMAKTN